MWTTLWVPSSVGAAISSRPGKKSSVISNCWVASRVLWLCHSAYSHFIFPKDSQISDCPPRKLVMEDNLMCFCHKKQHMRAVRTHLSLPCLRKPPQISLLYIRRSFSFPLPFAVRKVWRNLLCVF